jgi:hypothetical protein
MKFDERRYVESGYLPLTYQYTDQKIGRSLWSFFVFQKAPTEHRITYVRVLTIGIC